MPRGLGHSGVKRAGWEFHTGSFNGLEVVRSILAVGGLKVVIAPHLPFDFGEGGLGPRNGGQELIVH